MGLINVISNSFIKLSQDHTSILWVVRANSSVDFTQEEVVADSFVTNVIFQSLEELSSEDIHSKGSSQSVVISGGVSTSPSSLTKRGGPLSGIVLEEVVSGVDEVSQRAVDNNLSPSSNEFDIPLSRGFVVAVGEDEGAGNVEVEEDTVLESLSLEVPDPVSRSVVPDVLVNGTISETGLVVFSVV